MRVMWLGEDQEDDQGEDGIITLNRHVWTLRNYSTYSTYHTGSITFNCAYVVIGGYLLRRRQEALPNNNK